MSKKSFSKEIDNLMYRKIKSLENSYYDDFFKKDEYFELVLCLAYMTLSKEKIIKKDMKDNRRLERLTRMVPTVDIDLLFDSSFCDEMPRIFEAQEMDNTWILDNIRDSIMHGMFDIDEERKCFVINNDYFDRKLKAEVPFSWFISYAKNDILSKKVLDKCTIKGFYYNIGKQNKRRFETGKEAQQHILYIVDVEGSRINVRDLDRRVKELFDDASKRIISYEDVQKYEERLASEKVRYGDKYQVSFYMAMDYVKEQIEKEFPGSSVRIHIDNRKARDVNKITKNNPPICPGYDLLFEKLNSSIGKKSDMLLQYITNLIENLDSVSSLDFDSMHEEERVNVINQLLRDNKFKFTGWKDVSLCQEDNLKILRSICLNVYGLATLVMNHEDLYNDFFLNKSPQEYDIMAYSTKRFIDFATEERKLILDYLEQEIVVFDDSEALKTCTNPKGIEFRTKRMEKASKERDRIGKKISGLENEMKFERYINQELFNGEYHQNLLYKVNELYEHFKNASTVEGKRDIKKAIGEYLNDMMQLQSNYMYGYCRTMEEVLVIVRNAFSHIGRMYVGKDNFEDTLLILNDFDTDGKKSGAVVCRYFDLINMLRNPLFEDEKSTEIQDGVAK